MELEDKIGRGKWTEADGLVRKLEMVKKEGWNRRKVLIHQI